MAVPPSEDQIADEIVVFASGLSRERRRAAREEAAHAHLLMFFRETCQRFLQERCIFFHVPALRCLARKCLYERSVRRVLPLAQAFHDVEDLLCLQDIQPDIALLRDVDERVGRERIVACSFLCRDALEDEDHAGRQLALHIFWNLRKRKEAARQGCELRASLRQRFAQRRLEIVERQVGNRDAAGDVFEVDDLMLQLLHLFLAIREIVHAFLGFFVDDIFLARRRDVEQNHAPAHALHEINVFVEVFRRPEIHELHGRAPRADAVNAAEPLDDAHGIPMDVIVHEIVAVLEVLALGDAVRRDEDVDLALDLWIAAFLVLGMRRKERQERIEVGELDVMALEILERRLVVARARDFGRVGVMRGERGRELVVEVICRIGKRCENQNLAVAVVRRMRDFLADKCAKRRELLVAARSDGLGGNLELRQEFIVIGEVLPPAQEIHVLQKHFDLAAERCIGELWIIGIKAFDVERGIVDAALFVDDGEFVLDAPGNFPHGQREGMDRAFHALQEIHADEADELLLAVGLPEDGVAGLDFDIVFFRVCFALFRQQIGNRRVERERQALQSLVDLADVRELFLRVDARIFVARRQAFREASDFAHIVIFFDVATRAGDRHEVEQLEIILVHHVHETLHRALRVREVLPLVENELRPPQRRLDTRDALLQKCVVLALGDERDLILDVVHAIVDRRGREHQDARLHALLDDVFHEALIARHFVIGRIVVAEIMAFIDDEQIVVAPVHGREIDVAGGSSLAAEIGMIQHIVVEAIGGELVAPVVLRVDRPVLAQLLRAEHEHAVVAQLVVFDDGKRFKRLAEADAVRDDAAAVFLDLIDRAEHAVFLERKELVPDARVAETRPRLDDVLVREARKLVLEHMIER